MTNTLRLQGIGEVDAVPASELKAGDVRMYNFGSTALIIKVIEKTSKTLTIISIDDQGNYYISDIRKTKAVCIVKSGEDVSMHKPQEAYKVGRNRGMIDVSEYFQTVEEVEVQSETVEKVIVTEVNVNESTTAQTNENIIVKYNEQMNGIELYFSSIPSAETRDLLKANKFRYSKRGFWYTKQSPETISLVNNLIGLEAAENRPQEVVNAEQVNTITEPVTYPEIDINDLDQYIVTDELQLRLNSSSMFTVDYKQECINVFQSIQDDAIKIIETTDNPKIKHQIKSYLQSFKKSYYKHYIKLLTHKSLNPSWMVTGRGGMNISRYNKKQTQYEKLMLKVAELSTKYKQRLNKFKQEIRKDEQLTSEKEYNNKLKQLDTNPNFITETKEISFMGTTERLRTYNYEGYTVART